MITFFPCDQSIGIPNVLRQWAVDLTSSESSRFFSSAFPSAIALKIKARCEMDLSAGGWIFAEIRFFSTNVHAFLVPLPYDPSPAYDLSTYRISSLP